MTQTIYRPARRDQFTVVSNHIMNDERLLADETGVLVYLLSRPDDWSIQIDQLKTRFKFGRDKMQAIMRGLSDAGYARLESIADAGTGHFSGKRWIIVEAPESDRREPENPALGDDADNRLFRQSAKPTVGKSGCILNTELLPSTDSEPNTVPPLTPEVEREGGEGLCDLEEAPAERDGPDAWERFKAAWPWQAGAESVTAAGRAFEKLGEGDRELCAKGAEAFQPPPGRRVSAWAFIAERQWAFTGRRSATGAAPLARPGSDGNARRLPDGTWWLAPESPELKAWHEYERRSSRDRRAKPGCARPCEWPPSKVDHDASADRERNAA